jgi:hypothetical protein
MAKKKWTKVGDKLERTTEQTESVSMEDLLQEKAGLEHERDVLIAAIAEVDMQIEALAQ